MHKYCDLHVHSTFSDGTLSPTQIIDEASRLRLNAVALTDHNTIAGLPEFLTAAKNKNIEAIPGVEISTGYGKKPLHIVGLFIQPEFYDSLNEFLIIINIRKEESNRNLISNLRKHGYKIDYDEILANHEGNVNRAVIAAELRKKGYIKEVKEAFKYKGLLTPECGYYVPPKRTSAFETIAFLKSIHAVPILAHPFLDLTLEELLTFLPEAKKYGLAGLETHYSTFSETITEKAVQLAKKFELLESGGSDFHGTTKPDIALGTGRGNLSVPNSFVENMKKFQNL